MSAMDARNTGGQDKIVSVLHAQLKRVHGRLARTEALLRDEREARRDAERQLRERDNGAAAPTRALVEEAVAKASKAAEERDRAVADATEGRQALEVSYCRRVAVACAGYCTAWSRRPAASPELSFEVTS